MGTLVMRPHVDQLARDRIEDLGLIASGTGSGAGTFDDHALDAEVVLAQ